MSMWTREGSRAERERVRKLLIPIIAEVAEVSPEEILDTSRLGADLGIGETVGSGEFLVLMEKIEKRLEVEIPWEIIPPSNQVGEVTVRKVINLAQELLYAKEEKVTRRAKLSLGAPVKV